MKRLRKDANKYKRMPVWRSLAGRCAGEAASDVASGITIGSR